MVLIKWVEWRKETEVKEFKKVFRIPDIVNLDKIKARFNEEDGTLTVTMRKKFKGITGLKIEEEEEKVVPEEEQTEEKTEPEEETEEETKPEEEAESEEPQREKEDEAEEPQSDEEEEGKIEEDVVEEETRDHEEKKEEIEDKPRKKRRKKFRLPCFAGSTLLMSIIVFIIQLIQSRKK